jgi:hypothetical protein
MRSTIALSLALMAGLVSAPGGAAADQPPDELLDAIFPVLRGKRPAPPPLKNVFNRLPGVAPNPVCGLAKVDLVQTRGDQTRIFHLLADPALENDGQPKTILVGLSTIAVDADGSRRAYHPDDPFGNRCQKPSDDPAAQICAVDVLGDAEIYLYEHSKRISQFVGKPARPNPAFAAAWSSLWSEMAARKDRWVDLRAYFGDKTPDDTRLYYSGATDRAAVFDAGIIPFKAGFPCQHGDARDEYFVAATPNHPSPPPATGADACRTTAYLDSLEIPFFVLPGAFKQLKIGDIAIGLSTLGGAERLVFGVVGDHGPSQQIGEASIAFLQRLGGKTGAIRNVQQANALQIEAARTPAQPAAIGVLVLGGTAHLLGTDYSSQNIERVARAALADWSADHADRLQACLNSATANPLEGFRPPAN